jgi:tRNA pseudouridine38-40 synthase
MEHYQLTLAYDGTEFEGFQRQGSKRTVQLVLEQTLRKVGWSGKTILSAGRTDAGVHADGQVIAFDLEWRHSPQELRLALNSSLPPDVAVKDLKGAGAGFHPRFDAKARCYQYHLFFAPIRDPLRERFAWRIDWKLNQQVLNDASNVFVGRHDFSKVGRAMKPGASTERTVFFAGWKTYPGKGLIFQIIADAFLYHMVRRLVFLQVKIAAGRIELEEFRRGIQQQASLPTGIAPARGLFLHKIYFEKDWQEKLESFGETR